MIGLGLSVCETAIRRLIGPVTITLGNLSLSGTLTNGTASSGTIIGTTSGSTIAGALTGLSIQSPARTYTFDGTASVGAVGTLTETLSGATNSPHPTTLPAVASAAVQIPTNTVAPAISGGTAIGSTLTSATGTWANSPTSYTYQWNRNGTAISGATSSTYTTVSADGGASITCAVTASNSAGSGTPATSNTITITVVAPVNSVAPAVDGSATSVGTTLITSDGTWSGSPTFAYQWFRNGTAISGETTWHHTITSADAGTALTCVVTATNAGGSASATSNAVAIPVVAPVNSAAPVVSGSTTVGSTLTTTNGTWSGSPTYTYQWQRGSTAISGATAATYVSVSADTGLAVSCIVTATNAAGSASATSNAITVTASGTAWTPAQLGTALAAQWNLYDASTVTQNGSNFASATNQAASGTATLTQATASMQPPYTSGTGLVIPSASLGVAALGNMPTGEVTMFVIGSALPPDSGAYRNLFLTGYHENPVILYKGSSTQLGEYEGGSFYQFGSLTWSGSGFLLAHILTGTPNSAALNGSGWSAASTNYSAGPPVYMGNSDTGGQGFGTIHLVLVINGALSTSDKQKLEGWAARIPALQSQGITTALLPAGHPYKSVAP